MIKIVTTGGTIDKIYFDAKDNYEVGEPQVPEMLKRVGFTAAYELLPLLRKDSLQITEQDRQLIYETIAKDASCTRFVITHGTDTMANTGRLLSEMAREQNKTIVLTGAMQPALFRHSDAVFNIGAAVTAVQILPAGSWIAMNGQIFDSRYAIKNVQINRFEHTTHVTS